MIHDLNDPHPHDRRLAQMREETPADVARNYLPQVAAMVLGFVLAVIVGVMIERGVW